MPKILYDRSNCEGHFDCVDANPDGFAKGTEKAELLGGRRELEGLWVKDIPEEDVEQAIQATRMCPANVLKVVDDDGNVIEGPDQLPVEREISR